MDKIIFFVNWSGSALFAIQYVNSYQQSGSSNLIGWKFEMGVVSYKVGNHVIWKIGITKFLYQNSDNTGKKLDNILHHIQSIFTR